MPPTFTLDDVAEVIAESVKAAVAPLRERIAALEASLTFATKQLDSLSQTPGPPGERGADGASGRDGEPGAPGPPGPPGEDGADGVPGTPGERGADGVPGRDGRDGLPGVPGVQGEKGADGLNGKDGRDGLDGKDGFGFDDLRVEHDGERGFTFVFEHGARVKSFGPFIVPAQIHRGIWSADKHYSYQDAVTWNGCQWTCMSMDVHGKPGQPESGWLLTVKHGRDGKDGTKGLDGKAGRDGKDGRDARYS